MKEPAKDRPDLADGTVESRVGMVGDDGHTCLISALCELTSRI